MPVQWLLSAFLHVAMESQRRSALCYSRICYPHKVIPAGLDYTKKNIKVMKSPDDDDNRCFNEVIKHIQVLASQLTLEAMENYLLSLSTGGKKFSVKMKCK